ncbi:DNA-binding protein [Pseudomonas aeruginosa]|nr:DNA-binding protein [Pseudomonas aeruginosa]
MLALIGLCQGYYSDTRNVNTANGPSQIVEHSVLVQVEQTNKFGMPETKVIQVRISKRHMDGGLNNVWKMEKGKTVSVPVFIRAWASKSSNALNRVSLRLLAVGRWHAVETSNRSGESRLSGGLFRRKRTGRGQA